MIHQLNSTETAWMRGNLGALVELGIRLDPESLQALFDEQLAHWISLPPEQRFDPTPVITVIAIGLGEYVRHYTGLVWMIERTTAGSEIVLSAGLDPEATLRPARAIREAWNTRADDFLAAVAEQMIEREWRERARLIA